MGEREDQIKPIITIKEGLVKKRPYCVKRRQMQLFVDVDWDRRFDWWRDFEL